MSVAYEVSRPYEVQISEVLALCYAFSYLDGDGVFACLESKAYTGVVCAHKVIVVTVQNCFVRSCPTVGYGDLLLVCSALVDYKGCAAFLLVLQTDVYGYFINTSLFNSYLEGDVVISCTVAAVYVSVRHFAQIIGCTHFVVIDELTGRILVCVKTESVVELFGKCCGELEYVVCTVTVCVELGGYVGGGEFVITVYAYAFFDLVGMLVSDVAANGAYAPGLFKSCRVGGSRYLVAVSFALNYRRNIRTGLLGSSLLRSGLLGSSLLRSGLLRSGLLGSGLLGSSLLRSGLLGSSLLRSGLLRSGLLGSSSLGSSLLRSGCLRSGCLRSSCCGGGGCRSSYCGLLSSGNFFLTAKTGSNRQHHSDGHYQGQNAQNVLVFHYENLHLKFGAWLHGNIIS